METRRPTEDATARKVSCPACGAVYRIGEDINGKRHLKARCKKCGTIFPIDDLPQTNKEHSQESKSQTQGPDKSDETALRYKQTPVLQREIPHGGHDPFAVVIIIVCVIAMVFFAFMAYKSLTKGSHFNSIKRLLNSMTQNGFFLSSKKQVKPQTHRDLKSRKYSDLINAGHRYFRKKQYDRAIKLYTAAVAVDPDKVEAIYWRARAFQQKGETKKAISDLQKVIDINPNYVAAYNSLGWIYSNSRDWDKAITYFSRAIEINPKSGWAFYNRGRCYHAKGEEKKALEDAKRACDLGFELGCSVYKKYKQ